MKKAGYGPDKHLTIKLSTRNIPVYRDPSAILLDQLKEIWIDGELELVETANWVPKLIRKDFTLGLNVLGTAVDEPDVYFYQNYVSASKRNYPGYQRPRVRQAGRPAIAGTRPGEAQEDGSGRRLPLQEGWAGRSSTTCAPRPAGRRSSRA